MNKHITLKSRPEGVPQLDNFALEERPDPIIGDGEMLVVNRVFSMDAAIRGFLDDRPSYIPPVQLGETVFGMSLAEVIESNIADFPVGTYVRSMANWAEKSVLTADALGLEKVHPDPAMPLENYMGALGPVGLTAWVGLFQVGEAKPGETVLVSAAAGATGSTVGQLAKAKNCRVIGLVSTREKAEFIKSIGYDEAVIYKGCDDLAAAIQHAAPSGIDVYFENVGGEMLETVMPLMNDRGRIAVCGMIGQYNDADHPYGVKTLWQMVVHRLTMKGFLLYDYPECLAQAQAELEEWAKSGALKPFSNITEGFENIPAAFIRLMNGQTIGKTLVKP